MCFLIGLQVCFHNSMKHKNDVSNVIWLLWVVRIYSMCFVYKRTKTCCLCRHSLLKTLAKFVRIFKQVKTLDCISGFHWFALEFSQMFTSVFTRLRMHGEHVLFLKWLVIIGHRIVYCVIIISLGKGWVKFVQSFKPSQVTFLPNAKLIFYCHIFILFWQFLSFCSNFLHTSM